MTRRSSYVDYTAGRTAVYSHHAEHEAMKDRRIPKAEVEYVLAIHDSDVPGDAPPKREVTGDSGVGRLKVVIEPKPGEVRVITVHKVDWSYARRPSRR